MESMPLAGASLAQICTVTAMPALAMVIGSAAISLGEPAEQLQSRFQHLSAGLLIGAVVTDIFPIMKSHFIKVDPSGQQAVDWYSLCAAVIGFTLGLLLMYSVKNLSIQDIDAGEGGKDQIPDLDQSLLDNAGSAEAIPVDKRKSLTNAVENIFSRTKNLYELVVSDDVNREVVDEEVHAIDFLVDSIRRLSFNAGPIDGRNASRLRHHAAELADDIKSLKDINESDLPAIDEQLKVIAATLRHIHSHTERVVFRRWDHRHGKKIPDNAIKKSIIPWGLVLAVVIDSMVDGMLIGLAGSVALTSGWLMAMATAIEMGFLGYSFACAVVSTVTRCISVFILATPPLAMLLSSVFAASAADHVEQQPAFVGLIAFALVALLFLVMEELLLEAHEKEGGEVWQSSVWLYIGLLLSICVDVLL